MDSNSPYDDWSKHVHAVITFLKPYFDDWRGYVSFVSVFLGVGVLVMESQVFMRMRMGLWEIAGYVLSLLPAPVARSYRIMGGVCVVATALTLTSNVLYMLRGWKEPTEVFAMSSDAVRWLTSQIWYAIGMIFLFHVVTRPAQSGVVLFGKFPRDLWAHKWYLGILYIPVHYMLLELCNVHRDSKEILVPLEILVDIMLYNGPFLVFLLRVLYWAWKVAYDEALLTGAVFDDEGEGGGSSGDNPLGRFAGRRGAQSSRPGGGEYIGLATVDVDDAERGQGGLDDAAGIGSPRMGKGAGVEQRDDIYVLDDDDKDLAVSTSPSRSRSRSPMKAKSPVVKKSVMFDMDSRHSEEDGDQGANDERNRD
ncbi:hypothetical protein BGZ98_001294 [Dissophora globulifera]|nr:hypothetical protein BGZ98_001294 [Dissophora globulifera]